MSRRRLESCFRAFVFLGGWCWWGTGADRRKIIGVLSVKQTLPSEYVCADRFLHHLFPTPRSLPPSLEKAPQSLPYLRQDTLRSHEDSITSNNQRLSSELSPVRSPVCVANVTSTGRAENAYKLHPHREGIGTRRPVCSFESDIGFRAHGLFLSNGHGRFATGNSNSQSRRTRWIPTL